jgi:hypothetical protein
MQNENTMISLLTVDRSLNHKATVIVGQVVEESGEVGEGHPRAVLKVKASKNE